MLTLLDVTKGYGSRRVLDRLAVAIAPGESVALIGANGSGKTTTLRCIAGLAIPDSGRIVIGGREVTRRDGAARTRISYLPQRPAFPPTLTVRETLRVVAGLRGLPAQSAAREIEACGLAQVADRWVAQLSGGERQRLGLAVALMPDVDLYLFDEPSASLDPGALRILFERAAQLKEAGRTLLFTTHVPSDVRRLASRVLLLANGRIQSEGTTAFELRRYERMLAGFAWNDGNEDSHEDLDDRRDADADHRLRAAGAHAEIAAG